MAQLLLPNGKYVDVPDDWTEQEKADYLTELAKDTDYQEKQQVKKGALADMPDGIKTSWLFDNAVVAPYEASRKYLNSLSSLTEGIGDTLGERTNFGGFRYGKEADNNFFEYVPYDDAVKFGNVKGILAPITGNIGVNDSWHTKGFFYDPDKVNPEDNTETLTASFIEGGLQFILGYATGGKILKGLKVGTAVTTTQKIMLLK